MTASTISSTAITNKLANPPVYNTVAYEKGKVVKFVGSIAIATTSLDETGDIVLLQEVPGQLRITSIKLFNDDLDSGSPALAADLGIYKNPSADGTSATVVDADAYASADTSLQAAVTVGTELAFEARNINVMGQTVAVDGAESEHNDPRYIGLTVTTAAGTAAAGDLSWVIEGIMV